MNVPVSTLTLNPAIDVTYEISQLVADSKTNSKEANIFPGGNGINVSRGLKRLGKNAHTCCIFARETGSLIRSMLRAEGIYPVTLEVPGRNRVNCTIQQRRPPEEFKVAGIGPEITAESLEQITTIFLNLAGTGYGVLSGSTLPGAPENLYTDLAIKLRAQGARAVVDTKDAMLRETVEAKPFLIKPNKYELEVLCGRSLPTLEAIAEEARKVQQMGIDNVCVTMAEEGAILVDANNSYYAPAPKVRVRCSVGAGDTMLAGLISAFSDEKSLDEVLHLGLACASGSISRDGTELFHPGELETLMEKIEVKNLSI